MIEQRLLVLQQKIVTGIQLVGLGQTEVRSQQIPKRSACEPLPM